MNFRNVIVTITLIGLLISVLYLFLSRDTIYAPNSENAFEKILSQKKIKVGYIVFPPTITKDPNTKELNGHFVQTIREICSQAGIEPEFIETDWKGFAAGLKSGRFDISIAPTFVTIPRSLSVSFSRPLFYAGNGVVVKKDDNRFIKIKDFNSEGITVAVTQGSAAHEFALNNLQHAKLHVLPGPDQLLTLQEVISGRADAGFANSYDTQTFVGKNPEIVKDIFADEPYNLTPVSWAVSIKEPELLSFFNNALSTLEAQGKLKEHERVAGAHWLHEVTQYRFDTNVNK